MKKALFQEQLATLYLRLNGYFTTGMIIHAPPCGKRTPYARCLVAVLRVLKSWRAEKNGSGIEAHAQAAAWYQQQGLELPSNCMITMKGRKPLDMTDRSWPNLEAWDRHYRMRANKYGVFHACESLFCELHDPPKLTNDQLKEWFGRVPPTRNPPRLPANDFAKVLHWLASQVTDEVARRRLGNLAVSLEGARQDQ